MELKERVTLSRNERKAGGWKPASYKQARKQMGFSLELLWSLRGERNKQHLLWGGSRKPGQRRALKRNPTKCMSIKGEL